MPESKGPSEPISADFVLPPVEPPSAGFIVQLFVVPGVIVAVIIGVFLAIDWLAHMGSDPTTYIAALKRDNDSRWHAAVNLANALRNDDNAEIKSSPEVAAELAAILNDELDSGSGTSSGAKPDERLITLRIFLCKALGEFHVDDGLPALLKAAAMEHSEAELPVRVAAIESLAVLARNLEQETGNRAASSRMADTLLEASRDDRRTVRSAAAYALGVVGDEAAQERLEVMLDDVDPDTRFNAATGLARRGDTRVIAVLKEMLEPDQTGAIEIEQGTREDRREEAREFKRALIIVNGLRASKQLAEANSQADLTPLDGAVDRLLAGDIPNEVRVNAMVVSRQLKARSHSNQAAIN